MKIFSTQESPENLWQTLSHAGLAQGDMPDHAAQTHDDETPVYVKAMIGVAAWISSLFFLGFVFAVIGSVANHAAAWIIMGMIACAVAGVYFYQARSSVFMEQVFFVLALVGQAMVGMGMVGFSRVNRSDWAMMAVFEAGIVVAIAYRPNRFISAMAALLFLHYAILPWSNFLLPLYLAALALALHYQWRAPRLWPVVALALSLMAFWADTRGNWLRWLYGNEGLGNMPFWVWRAGLIAVWLGVVYALLKKTTSKPLAFENSGIWLLAILLAAGTWLTPMALFALAVFFLGFSQRDKILEGIGMVELLWAVSHYYYSLEDTLLFKSLTLAGLGAGLLLLYAVSRYVWPAAGQEERA